LVPEKQREAILPIMSQIGQLTEAIKKYDKIIRQMCQKEFRETEMLMQVDGVGEITSLAYVLTVETPERFPKSRDAGAYTGLVPKQRDSGDNTPQLRITKTGDRMLRRLLVGSAQYILGPFGKDCDLKRHGLKIATRGGKNAKKRAAVAVARKLAVLLHRLWLRGEEYDPFYNSKQKEALAKAS
jgi:transposase